MEHASGLFCLAAYGAVAEGDFFLAAFFEPLNEGVFDFGEFRGSRMILALSEGREGVELPVLGGAIGEVIGHT